MLTPRSPLEATMARSVDQRRSLVVWSAAESPELAESLRGVFPVVEAQPHEVRLQERDERYWLYVARG